MAVDNTIRGVHILLYKLTDIFYIYTQKKLHQQQFFSLTPIEVLMLHSDLKWQT